MKSRYFVDFLLYAFIGYCQILRDTACFCRVLCSQDRSQEKVGRSRFFPGVPRDKK